MNETKLREEICRLGRSLFERGLTPGSSGNISVRCEDGGWLVTPTNASLGSLDPVRLSRLGPDGRLVSGDAPTKEVPLHTALYQTRSAARAVVHLHSTHSVALSMLPEIDPRAALPPMTPYYLMKCGLTALVPYYRPGDPAVADAIKGLAGKYSSVLLANHGPVVSGDTLEAAVFAIEELEETAKLYLLLRGLNPRFLTPAQVADLAKTFGAVLPTHDEHRSSEKEDILTRPASPTDAEVEAAARALDKAGRHHHWWPAHIKPYDEFSKTDSIAKSEFEGIVEQILMAASAAKRKTELP
jgi:ribulose-5-phosphate 4-epimerase/fuculose-1-phosphate aldolase